MKKLLTLSLFALLVLSPLRVGAASYTVASAKHAILVAATVDTITITRSFGAVRVTNYASNTVPLWVRLDGTAPTVGGDDNYIIPVGESKDLPPPATESIVVKVISANANGYSVEGF